MGAQMKAAAAVGAFMLLAFAGTAGLAAADAAEIRVYSSGAPAEAVKAIAADFAKDTGHQLTFIVGQPATIQRDLKAGDKADLVILPARVVTKLTGAGVLRADGAAALARVGIGVAVRAGATPPGIADAAAIRKLLIEAHSIVYPDPQEPGGGSTGHAVARMIERMGLTDTVRPKLTLSSAIGGGVALVAAGKAEIGFFNISEIMPIKGATLAGPLPAELQNYIVFSAAIPVANTAPDPAAAFIKRLADPAARSAWQAAGLEPLAAAP
jgi:molybdate transport system substrate-binding protein